MAYADTLSDRAIFSSARAIIEFDQYDDWIPDCVHLEDMRSRLAQPGPLIKQIRRASTAPSQVEVTALPRKSASPLFAATLPVDFRVQIHAATTRIAGRVRAKLSRDRVLGFNYKPEAPELFSTPGDGLVDLADLLKDGLASELLFDHDDVVVLDIKGAWANSSWNKLKLVLAEAGAGVEDLDMVGRAYGRAGGLLTGDDAWAFLTNYAFRPIDMALLAQKANFYRVRDEYVVFEKKSERMARATLARFGFDSRRIDTSRLFAHFTDYEADLLEKCEEQSRTGASRAIEEVVQQTEYYDIVATTDCNSDGAELEVRRHGPLSAAAAVDQLINQIGTVWDAIDLAPILRPVWQARRDMVLRRSPGASPYKSKITRASARLSAALSRASGPNKAWTGHIVSILLSDAGALSPTDVAGLIGYANFPAAVLRGAGARAALARGSTLPAERVLPAGFPHAAEPSHRRWEGLIGLYLAQRGIPRPFAAWLGKCSAPEPQLAETLSSAARLGL